MSFREKSHWVGLLAIILAFGWYFAAFPWTLIDTPDAARLAVFRLIPVVIIFLVPMIAATIWFAIRTPDEANMAEDEREKLIHRRGTHIAYYPLVLGVWANILVAILGFSGGVTVMLLISTLVACEMLRIGAQLFLYRRGT